MKTLLVFALFALITIGAVPGIAAGNSTATNEQETLFSGDVDHGGYGGVQVKASSVVGEPAVLVGGYGGWFIDHTLMVGAGGYGLVNNIAAPSEAGLIRNRQPSIGFGYGGPMLEFTGNSNSLVHYTVHVLVGAGGAGYYVRSGSDWDDDLDVDFSDSNWDACFAAEIGAGVELNVASFFRINAGASMLFVNGIDLPGLTDSDISGPSAHLTLKFGKF